MKICRSCGTEKPLDHFYVNKKMADGRLNHCKVCKTKYSFDYRQNNKEKICEYEKTRTMLPHRVQQRLAYVQTEKGKVAKQRANTSWRKKFPMKYAAHLIVAKAIKNNVLQPQLFCEGCGNDQTIQAHHDDYTKPLEVRWLCAKCHSEWHKKNKPIYE